MDFFSRLKRAPRLKRSDLVWTVLPFLLWWFSVGYCRDRWIRPVCVDQPQICEKSQVNALDRVAFDSYREGADEKSFFTQNASGVIALTVPVLVALTSPATALLAIGTDWVILVQTVGWNGLLTEVSHLISQRPRPFIFGNPGEQLNPAHYTSFYSGHTSFSSASMHGLFFAMLGRGLSTPALSILLVLTEILVISTGTFRVFSGRHFPSDVFAGALAGFLVALAVARRHRKSNAA